MSDSQAPAAPALRPGLAVIIPVWNLWDMTLPCLESLAAHSQGHALEVIVVDNGSTDATREALGPSGARLFGAAFRRIRFDQNLGFAKACNAGARAASAPLLFFLNNDTLLTPNWLPPLLESLQGSPSLGMVGPLLLLPGTGRVQHCGIAFAPTLEVSHLYALFPGGHPLVRAQRKVQALTGAACLLPRALFLRCGLFHEGYVNGFEDMDLCCQLRQQNLRLACVPRSVVYHLTSQTPGRADHDAPNAHLLNQRHPHGFLPDLHRIGAEDGFVPRLSAALELYLSLPDALESSLTTAFTQDLAKQRFSADRCRARLESQPLWEGGYSLLAQHLLSQQHFAEAVEVYSSQLHFFPKPHYALALARAAAQSGEQALARTAAEAAASLAHTAADHQALHKKAQALATWSHESGDPALAKLFTDWLESMGGAAPQTPRKGPEAP